MARTVMRAGPVSTGLKTRKQAKRVKLRWAYDMRKNPTKAEAAMWERLRKCGLGFKFRRQALVRGYIIDFWCPKVKLVVEVDGDYHKRPQQQERDDTRDRALASLGIETVRFTNTEVATDLDAVCTQIFQRACQRLRDTENARKTDPRRASREAAGNKAGEEPPGPQVG